MKIMGDHDNARSHLGLEVSVLFCLFRLHLLRQAKLSTMTTTMMMQMMMMAICNENDDEMIWV